MNYLIMKKDVLIILLFVLLVAAVLGIIGLNLTGYVSWAPDFQGIFRGVPIKNTETNTTDVYLRVASIENVIAIQEFFSSPDCKVLSYSLNKDIDIFEFNDNENTWIFANSSDFLDVELFYQIPYECNINSGKYYTRYSFSGNNWCNGADTNKDSRIDTTDYITVKMNYGRTGCNVSNNWCSGADITRDGKVDYPDWQILLSEFGSGNCSESPNSSIYSYDYQPPITNDTLSNASATSTISPSPSGGGSSSNSGGGSSTIQAATQINTNEIIQIKTNEEYEAQSLSATEKLAQISEEPQIADKYSGYIMASLTVIALLIIGFIIFSLFKSPKGSR